MNTILWILQSLIAAVFLYSGLQKSFFPEQKLVASGQTGVAGLAPGLIKFIGISEILGTVGLIVPLLCHISPVLTILAAIGLAIIMIPAAIIHYKRQEPKNVLTNCIIFLICVFIAYGRTKLVG